MNNRIILFCLLCVTALSSHAFYVEDAEDFTSASFSQTENQPAVAAQPDAIRAQSVTSAHDAAIDRLTTESIKSTARSIVTIDLTAPVDDIWQRIRNGFAMQDLNTPLVMEQQSFYVARKDYLLRTLERARPYLYMIVEEIEKRGLPTELALLPMVESAYNPMALSPANASGLWQFIPSTGRSYGLDQNWWVDKRRDVIASTQAALEYLKYTYNMHGDWHLALASYNWGEGSVGRAVRKNLAQDLPGSYEHLTMPKETQHYVPKLQALKNIIAYPHLYGLHLPDIPNRAYLATIEKQYSIDVNLAAQLAEMPLDEFKRLNPSFKRPIISAHEGNSQIVLPADKVDIFTRNLAAHKASDRPMVSWTSHRLEKSETLSSVAQRLNMTVAQLRSTNGLNHRLRTLAAGTTLLIPSRSASFSGIASSSTDKRLAVTSAEAGVTGSTPATERASTKPIQSVHKPQPRAEQTSVTPDSTTSHPENTGITRTAPRIMLASGEQATGTIQRVIYSEEDIKAAPRTAAYSDQEDITERMNNPPTESTASTERKMPVYYRVRKGDTLQSIAGKHGTTTSEIKRLNGIKGNQVKLGQNIKVGQRTATVQNSHSQSGSRQSASRTYRIRQGDTLSSIAKANNISVSNLRAANNINGNSIRPGQTLILSTKSSKESQNRTRSSNRRNRK